MRQIPKIIQTLFFILKLYKIGVAILVSLLFLYVFLRNEPDPKEELAKLPYKERQKLQKEYIKKLFVMSKENNISYSKIDYLLRSGININTQDESGKTPIFYAILNKNDTLFRYFLHRGANIEIEDDNNKKIIDYLQKNSANYREIIAYKARKKAQEAGLTHTSVSMSYDNNGNIKNIQVSGEQESSWSSLMLAIKDFENEKVQSYIENGSNLEARTNNNSTAIFFAIKFQNNEALDMLLAHGVNIERRNNFNVTPLALAITQNNLYAVKKLVTHGVNLHTKLDSLRTPVEFAHVNRREKIANYLKSVGAS